MLSETLKSYFIAGLCLILFVCSVVGGYLVYKNVSLKLEHTVTEFQLTQKELKDVLESNRKLNLVLEQRSKKGREYNKQLMEALDGINTIKSNECFDAPHGDSVNQLLNSIGGQEGTNSKTVGDTLQD